MDATRFDELARKLAAGATRRGALRAAAGGALAAALAALRPTEAGAQDVGAAATCRCSYSGPKRFCQSEKCDFDEQCCSRKCESEIFRRAGCGREKRCLCRLEGARCARDCACCSGQCRANGRCA